MNKIWYTRDDDGQRALWNDVPVKSDGVWWTNENQRGNYKLISADWNGDDESIDSIIGEGFQGLRKGQIAELVITWNRMA
jgi:hypothetical protein